MLDYVAVEEEMGLYAAPTSPSQSITSSQPSTLVTPVCYPQLFRRGALPRTRRCSSRPRPSCPRRRRPTSHTPPSATRPTSTLLTPSRATCRRTTRPARRAARLVFSTSKKSLFVCVCVQKTFLSPLSRSAPLPSDLQISEIR